MHEHRIKSSIGKLEQNSRAEKCKISAFIYLPWIPQSLFYICYGMDYEVIRVRFSSRAELVLFFIASWGSSSLLSIVALCGAHH
jgi:hypothetical protein